MSAALGASLDCLDVLVWLDSSAGWKCVDNILLALDSVDGLLLPLLDRLFPLSKCGKSPLFSRFTLSLFLDQKLWLFLDLRLPLSLEPRLPLCLEPRLPLCLEPRLPLCLEPRLPLCLEPRLPLCLEPRLPLFLEPRLPPFLPLNVKLSLFLPELCRLPGINKSNVSCDDDLRC